VAPDTPADAGTNSAGRYGCGQLRQNAPQGSRAARSDALGQRDEYGTRAHGGDVRGEHPRACRAMLVTSDRQYLVADQLCAAEQGKQANRGRSHSGRAGGGHSNHRRQPEQQQHPGRVRQATAGATVCGDRQGRRHGTCGHAPNAGCAALIRAPIHVAEPTQCRIVTYLGRALPYGYSVTCESSTQEDRREWGDQ